jgi:CheY-like chemotaxis protein
MSDAYERGAIVVVAAGSTGERPPVDLLERLGRRQADAAALVGAGPDTNLADLVDNPDVGAIVVDLRGDDAHWARVRPILTAGAGADDAPLLLVGDDASWPRVLEVLDTGRGDGVRLPCTDAELWARLRGVSAARRARELERDRLARAIHDDSLQVLAAVAMRLQLLRRRAAAVLDAPAGTEVGASPAAAGRADTEDALALDEVIDDLGAALERLRTLETERRGVAPAAGPGGRWTTRDPADLARPGDGRFPNLLETSLWGSPELLSRLSHDLRSPLNAVLGFAQLLELGELDSDQADAVRQIIRAGTRLLELINEVVDLSRIEAGYLDLSLEPVDPREVVRDALDLMRPAAAEAAVDLATPAFSAPAAARERVMGAAELPVMADRQRLLQVLLILLSNAVRYNEAGGHVSVELEPAGSHVRLTVTDDGIGIDPARLHSVFVPFDRLGGDRQGLAGGGLGLAIAKGLVTRMGGHISVDSSPGEGSRFWFELRSAPVAPSEAELDAAAVAGPLPAGVTPFEVLYIEDNPTSLRLVERVLGRREGVSMIPAMQGRLGVQLAAQRQPAMVLVDLHLPDMAGRDVVHALKADPLTRHIPVVVLSANAIRPQEPSGGVEGARAYLTKPFQIDTLLSLVDTIRAERAAADRVESAGTTTMSRSDAGPAVPAPPAGSGAAHRDDLAGERRP